MIKKLTNNKNVSKRDENANDIEENVMKMWASVVTTQLTIGKLLASHKNVSDSGKNVSKK